MKLSSLTLPLQKFLDRIIAEIQKDFVLHHFEMYNLA